MGDEFVQRRMTPAHEILKDAVEHYRSECGVGVPGQAAMIGRQVFGQARKEGVLYKYMEGERPIPLDVFLSIHDYSKYRPMARWIAQRMGGVFVPLPGPDDAEGTLIDFVKEFTEGATTTSKALKDGKITRTELPACLKELDDAIEAAHRLKAKLQQMCDSGGRDLRVIQNEKF